ncbi:MAG: SiaB family protein kinase [Salinivirgaceae bacterium]|jgi:hypothetical protein
MTQVLSKNIISFQGELTFEIIESLLNSAKQELDSLNLDLVVQKRLYSILVESLENSVKHRIPIDFKRNHYPLEMNLQLYNNKILITVCNYIKQSNAELIAQKIDEVNSLNRDGLNQLYRSSIAKARISDKGGAGLGIIEMARNSGQKINYKFVQEESELVFFILELSLLKCASKN